MFTSDLPFLSLHVARLTLLPSDFTLFIPQAQSYIGS